MSDIGYYPAKRYIEKGWAAERNLKPYDFAALSIAQKRAVEFGVLSPDLAKRMIPMAIVEGRSQNHGIDFGYKVYASPANIERFRKMGLNVVDADGIPRSPDGFKKLPEDTHMLVEKIGKDRYLTINGGHAWDAMATARLMAGVLSEKASHNDIKTVDDAVKRYNGRGRAIERAERTGNVDQQADVNVYLQKVNEAHQMLNDPKNAPLTSYIRSMGGQF